MNTKSIEKFVESLLIELEESHNSWAGNTQDPGAYKEEVAEYISEKRARFDKLLKNLAKRVTK